LPTTGGDVISVLEHTGGDGVELSLSVLHAQGEKVSNDLLPCRANDPDLWFAESPDDVEIAKTLCLGCPIQHLCLSGAIQRGEPCGVWGGQLFLKGAVIARKRLAGRPRKDETAA
jgi:WhiB family redox-sensing transcriptional regulator